MAREQEEELRSQSPRPYPVSLRLQYSPTEISECNQDPQNQDLLVSQEAQGPCDLRVCLPPWFDSAATEPSRGNVHVQYARFPAAYNDLLAEDYQ